MIAGRNRDHDPALGRVLGGVVHTAGPEAGVAGMTTTREVEARAKATAGPEVGHRGEADPNRDRKATR